MAALEPDELRAVLIHENAHLSQRHHLLLWAFAAWRQALPWLPTTRLAQESVNSLIEMLADDVALKTESKATLIKAIAIVASGSQTAPATRLAFGEPGLPDADPNQPGATGGTGSAGTTASRVSRLLSPQPPLPEALRAAVLAACVLLLALPTALLLVPGLLG
jgi:Zn-dependent protease with chaperone function